MGSRLVFGSEGLTVLNAEGAHKRATQRLRIEEHILPVGVVLFAVFWFLESLADALFFGRGLSAGAFFPTEPEEVFGRGLMAAIIIAFLAYVQGSVNRRRRLEDAARRRADISRFLSEASAALSSLDHRETLGRVARVSVPFLADWCAVDVVEEGEEGDSLVRVAIAHEDPQKADLARKLQERYPPDPGARHGSPRVVGTGEAEIVSEVSGTMIDEIARDDEHRSLLERLGIGSFMVMPLAARGKTLGAITFVAAGRRYGDEDVELAEELVHRAALAVDNARLYERARRELAEREEAERQLRAAEIRYRTLIEQIPAVIYIQEVEGAEDSKAVSYISRRVENLLGYAAEEEMADPEHWIRVLHPDDRERVLAEDERTDRTGDPFNVEYRQIAKDGSVVWIRDDAVLVRDPDGRPLYWQGVQFDITRSKLAEAELERQARELERSNEELERFAYIASHDLQEPLRMVSSYTQLLARRYGDKLDDDAREFIGYAVDGATRMQTLINDLLRFSRVETRGRELVPTDLGHALEAALANLRVAIGECDAEVTFDPMPTVAGDEVQLVQLFQNLIGNAIKFRREESPRVHVGAQREAGRWQISVADNGIGIEEQYLERIFVIFRRLHGRDEYQGTGIGLAICKKIVERHGGRIWVESKPGQGSTFLFTLRDAEGEGP